ncbi:hypothetical protein D4R42_04510 [bacterium]|nr:MAG: hypothetical protein D4R42_04510 [bacterium]
MKYIAKGKVRELIGQIYDEVVSVNEGLQALVELVEEDKTIHPVSLFYKLRIQKLEQSFHSHVEAIESTLDHEDYPGSHHLVATMCSNGHDALVELTRKCIALLKDNKHRFTCDALCVHFMKKECITERDDGMCDQLHDYKEIGDLADRLKDEAEDP